MRDRRLLVLAILVYVALDLSIAAMPGAFVFNADESTEGTSARTRLPDEADTLPAVVPGPEFVLFQLPAEDVGQLPVMPAERRARRAVSRQSLALEDPGPSSEDPH